MSTTSEQAGYLGLLEDVALMLKKVETNLKKCPKQRLTDGYVKARLQQLEEYWQTFSKANQDLTKCTPREKRGTMTYFLNEEYYTYEDIYLNIKADLLDLLERRQSKTKPEEPSINTSDMALSCVKLPRIQLPCFSGKYEEFPTFEDLFTSVVHNSTSISNVQKLHYLKTSVSGEAEALLRHIKITENNYIQAWDMLKNRYGNKRLITTSLLKRLFNQKKIINQSAQYIKSLMDTTTECLNSLRNLGVSTDTWDPLIVFLVVQKLDLQTHKEWEEQAYNEKMDELPKWEELRKFLESKFRTLELITPMSQPPSVRERVHAQKSFHVITNHQEEKDVRAVNNNTKAQVDCCFCNGNHYLFNCKEFGKQQMDDRYSFVQKNNLCFNCLIPNHSAFRCKRNTSCRICRRRHHSLLHRDKTQLKEDENNATTETTENSEQTETRITVHYSSEEPSDKRVLLATALIDVLSSSGESHVFRALLDQGSEASFITARVVELLGLKKIEVCGIVSGVGEEKQSIRHKVKLSMMSGSQSPLNVDAYVMKTISSNLPATQVNISWPEIKSLKLADPTCNQPGKIDILLGADIFAKIIEEGVVHLQDGLVAQNTRLGWILSGQTNNTIQKTTVITSLFIREDNDMLRRFWEIETELYKKRKILTKEEEQCETIYRNTTIRDEDGRYIVHLPLKQNLKEVLKQVGDTKQQAIMRFQQLERKFERNIELKEEYKGVIREYIDMGHMKKIESEEDKVIYLPHHAVVRADKDTTKVRVVFDASAKGSNGYSLNDMMMVGPVLQPDLRSLITSWRKHKICVVGDIIKMYRMLNVAEEYTNLQGIVWRNSKDEKLDSYKLLTVTFGTAAAPYLAVRTLIQVAEDEAHDDPDVADAIKNCFYMDDFMAGYDDVEKAKTICQKIKRVLKRGGFEMQKMSSNSEELLSFLKEGPEITKDKIEIKLDQIIKILGLTWDRKDDTFKVTVDLPDMKDTVTKRSILSDIARLFDPFGWLSQVIITAKIMIQRLWLCNLGWDDELPLDLKEEWMTYRYELTYLQAIEIPRWLQTTPRCKEVQLHGFADASSTAYAAVTYLRVVDEYDVIHVTMISSRTKVAPIKQLSIPRLELCAAVLLAELIGDISERLHISKSDIFAYTDSMIVLAWLQSQPSRWQTFVANRVSDILRILDNDRWRHIKTDENPADIASRGIKAANLSTNEIWWHGPNWMRSEKIENLRCNIPQTNLEMRNFFYTDTQDEEQPIWERFSTLSRMKRVLAYCKRFLSTKERERGERNLFLTTEEIESILLSCVRYYQNKTYGKEIQDLTQEGKVRNKSPLITLSPFLDKNGIMKVGGRLQNAEILETSKHPMIIPKDTHLAKLIIAEAHTKTLHGGIQMMMAYIRSRYWVIGLKAAVRRHIRTCKICILDKARVKTQFMGQLPAVRVRPNRAFLNSGVDYAGPIQIRMSKGRGYQSTKGYICLFVCMSTRAIHLEAVTDLTAQGFIAAFRRFVSRRGSCANLWSDNGTNFVGAAKELKTLFKKGRANMASEVAELLANDGTTWHFIPPRMPNYGGLWEAGVQSAKRHLTRVNGDSRLTYEEMATLLTQVEACLNSRPLCQLDDTIETLNPLTPGHFLVGEALISVPNENLKDRNINLLTRWQLIQSMTQDFWRRWQGEYLNTMQQRYKWQVPIPAPNIGDIVVIKEDGLPPTKWLLGRIKSVHPGSDNLVRVVTVQCKGNSELKRPLSKLIALPYADNC